MFDRDEQDISRIIAEGLEAILSGTSTMEEVIAAHPEQEALLRTELESARWLVARQGEVSSRPGFVAASRKRVVNRIQEEAANHSAKHGLFGFFVWPRRIAYQWAAVLVIVVLLLSSTGGLVSASQSAIPGDNLYAIKRITEEIAYTITFNATQRMELSVKYARLRLQEAAALITRKNYEAVIPVLQEFQQQVNQAVALLQQITANGSPKSPNELREQKRVAVALKTDINQNTDMLEMMQSAMLPPNVTNELLDAQQLSQASLETTQSMINTLDTGLGLPVETPTQTPEVNPTETTTPEPADGISGTPEPTGEPDETQSATGLPQSDELANPVIVTTPTPTGTKVKDNPGNSSHLTPPPGQQKKDDNSNNKNKSPKTENAPPGQANSDKPTKQANK